MRQIEIPDVNYRGINIEKAAFLLGMTMLGWGIYRWSAAGLFLVIGVLVLVTAPEDEENV